MGSECGGDARPCRPEAPVPAVAPHEASAASLWHAAASPERATEGEDAEAATVLSVTHGVGHTRHAQNTRQPLEQGPARGSRHT